MSTDSYEDTWHPFFKLLNIYWPQCDYPIVLNTETKTYNYPGLDIRCAKVGRPRGKHPTWGQCMHKILSEIGTDFVLYLDCDYFISGPVDIRQLEEFAALMTMTRCTLQACAHIGLTHMGTHSPFHVTEFPLLWETDPGARYRLCLQAGLWRRDTFASCIRPGDNNWDFEESSHLRGRRIAGRFLTVNRHVFNPEGRQIVPYTHTGIIQGRWNRKAVEELFPRHGIDIDFRRRGFTDEVSAKEHLPISFGVRVRSAIRRRCSRLRGRINASIDRFRY